LASPVKRSTEKPELQQALTITARASQNRAFEVLILASSSAYRRSLLERLRVPFVVCAPEIDEAPLSGEAPRQTALRLAEQKARAVGAELGDVIIGSDQVAVLNGTPLGKPGTHEAALAQLQRMRGRALVFHTAVCVLEARSGRCQVEEVPTSVVCRDYTDEEAIRYLELDRPYDCAGSAKIEALGIALVEEVVSRDPTALIGLPLIALVTMLRRAGVAVL
jgi:septum formation protein